MKRGPLGRTSLRDYVDFASDSSGSSDSASQSPADSDNERARGRDEYDSDEDLEIMIKKRRRGRRGPFGDGDGGDNDEGERYKRPVAFVKKGFAADEMLEHEYDDDDDNNSNNNEDNNDDWNYDELPRGGLGYGRGNSSDTRKNYSNFLDLDSSNRNSKDAFDTVYGKGSKMLKSMGWNAGEGLGKEKDGIAEPIQVKLRPKGRGLGCGVDEKTEQQKRMEVPRKKRAPSPPSSVSTGAAAAAAAAGGGGAEYTALPEEEKLWMKKNKRKSRGARRGPKYVVIEEDGDGSGAGHPREIVTDMRGPHARIVGSVAEALRSGAADSEGGEDEWGGSAGEKKSNPLLPLQHNVQLLANMARERMQAGSRRVNEAGTTLSALERSVAREAQTLEATRQTIRKLGELRAAVAAIARRQWTGSSSGTSSSSSNSSGNSNSNSSVELCKALSALKAKFPEEWARFNFDGLALGMSKPILVEELVFWNPITDPTDYLDEFDAWRHLFLSPEAAAGKQEQEQEQEHEQQNKNRNKNKKDDGNGNAAAGEDVFSSMLTEVFLPRVRAVALEWNARDYEPMINFFLLWTPVLTQTIRDYIAANVILPRLQAEVGAWSPRTDPVPVHLWLHPWLPVLGAPLLEPLWAPIRHKMCAALEAWQPADPSAHAVLAPWAPVFGAAAMAALLRRSVVPKLAAALRRHEVTAGPLGTDPQELPRAELVARLGAEAFVWAAAWTDLLGADAAAQLLEAAAFFQGWARALLAWVAGTGKVDAEVGWWYQGWKLLFPEALVKHKTVQRYLRYALDLMGCALAGKPYPPLPAAATITTAATGSSSLGLPAEAAASSRSQTSLSLLATQQHVGLTLREVLEQLAARTNVLFTPTTKTHEGKDVYKFGSTSVVVDSKLVYAHNTETGKWESVTLDELMRRNNSGSNAPSSSSYDDVE